MIVSRGKFSRLFDCVGSAEEFSFSVSSQYLQSFFSASCRQLAKSSRGKFSNDSFLSFQFECSVAIKNVKTMNKKTV